MRTEVRSVRMEWSIPNTFYSDYFHTLHGQLEYWILWAFCGHMERYGKWMKTPPFWCGAENSIGLYLEHPSYSPFLYHPVYGNPKESLKWDMRNVPEGQDHEVDENFIPKRLVQNF